METEPQKPESEDKEKEAEPEKPETPISTPALSPVHSDYHPDQVYMDIQIDGIETGRVIF
jgi:hypothetical protein